MNTDKYQYIMSVFSNYCATDSGYIQRQLGHHSIQITADTYSHLIPTTDRKAVNALDD